MKTQYVTTGKPRIAPKPTNPHYDVSMGKSGKTETIGYQVAIGCKADSKLQKESERIKNAVTLRRIATYYARHTAVNPDNHDEVIELSAEFYGELHSMPANHRRWLRFAWIYSRKVPVSERLDMLSHLICELITKKPQTESHTSVATHSIYVDWYRQHRSKYADTINLQHEIVPDGSIVVADTIKAQKDKLGEMIEEIQLTSVLDSCPDWVRELLVRRMNGEKIGGNQKRLQAWAIENAGLLGIEDSLPVYVK